MSASVPRSQRSLKENGVRNARTNGTKSVATGYMDENSIPFEKASLLIQDILIGIIDTCSRGKELDKAKEHFIKSTVPMSPIGLRVDRFGRVHHDSTAIGNKD